MNRENTVVSARVARFLRKAVNMLALVAAIIFGLALLLDLLEANLGDAFTSTTLLLVGLLCLALHAAGIGGGWRGRGRRR